MDMVWSGAGEWEGWMVEDALGEDAKGQPGGRTLSYTSDFCLRSS